jgi:predicted nucleotidyltransferase
MEIKQEIELVSKLKNHAVNKRGTLFNLYISGSHLYGWNSEDSDIDIRGSILLDGENFLGLDSPKEVFEIKNIGDYDIVLFELKKLIKLAIKGNCNILEEINAPQFYKNADFVKLQQLINNAFGKKGIYNSYKGLAEFNYKKFIKQGRNTVKKYLYIFRGLMAGIYCLETGIVQPNLEKLNAYKQFKIPEVDKLLEIKRKGTEKMSLRDLEEGKLDLIIKDLFDKLDKAYLKSKIPELPRKEDVEEIDKFLIKLRCVEENK